MAAHLKSRCEGLLEVYNILDRNWESRLDDDNVEFDLRALADTAATREEGELEKRLKISRKVSYLHRTVKDFLKTPDIRIKLQRCTLSLPTSNRISHY
jgi:hypothetical protein